MSHRRGQDHRWSGKVSTTSTFPPPGLFNEDATTIATIMATPEVSPGGIGAAIRMVTYFVNRAGRDLPAIRRAVLGEAKRMLQARLAELPRTNPASRKPGFYRHLSLGPVRVARHGRSWVMLRDGNAPPIPVGPDGWRYLEPA